VALKKILGPKTCHRKVENLEMDKTRGPILRCQAMGNPLLRMVKPSNHAGWFKQQKSIQFGWLKKNVNTHEII